METVMHTRRNILLAGVAGAAVLATLRFRSSPAQAETHFKVTMTDAEWRAKLSPGQYAVLRKSATERPFTSPLNDEHHEGTFACAGCQLALFASKTKFDSHTGWPSFWAPIDNAVGTEDDNSLMMSRTAVHCAQCGGHLGHVFPDGPPPTGQRYCMNGIAMTFQPRAA
jgi:peptide-methionine (R)-S-oxide reductase